MFFILGISGSSRSYGSYESSDKCILEDEEIARLRNQFETAKHSFLNIPDALKEMPKMNPKGYSIVSACYFLFN